MVIGYCPFLFPLGGGIIAIVVINKFNKQLISNNLNIWQILHL